MRGPFQHLVRFNEKCKICNKNYCKVFEGEGGGWVAFQLRLYFYIKNTDPEIHHGVPFRKRRPLKARSTRKHRALESRGPQMAWGPRKHRAPESRGPQMAWGPKECGGPESRGPQMAWGH